MRRTATFILGLAMVGLCVGCGGDNAVISGSSTNSQVGATPGSDEMAKDPSTILTDASKSMQALQSYHVAFKGSYYLGSMQFSMDVDPNQQAKGTMTVN